MEREIIVSVEVTPYRSELFRKSTDKVRLREPSTIYDLLALLYKSYLIGEKYSDKNVGWANIFWGYLLYKSGEFVGNFDKEGFIARKGARFMLKDGDQIIITPPIGGG